MRASRSIAGGVVREMALGAFIGFWLLGIGGRIAMRFAAVALHQPPVLSAGSLTVLAAGAGAGAAGAVLHALARAGARAWHGRAPRIVRHALFAALLALVTARGLSGSPGPVWPFWLLVAAYGALLEILAERLARRDHTRPALPETPPSRYT